MANAAWIAELRSRLGGEMVLTGHAELVAYGFDATYEQGLPEAVVLPRTTQQVRHVLAVAHASGIPVFPRGAGSGLSGGSVPSGGIALALTRMNTIWEVNPEALQAEVEAGVVTADLQRIVREHGLLYAPDPGSASVSTIGGNIAENAAGPHSFRFGPTSHHVLGLEVVLADGEVVTLGGRTSKNVSGYDLVRLIVGSEGTLGVVTRARLRLLPLPQGRASAVTVAPSFQAIQDLIVRLARSPQRPSSIEFLDRACLNLLSEDLAGLITIAPWVQGLLLTDFLAPPQEAVAEAEAAADVVRSAGFEAWVFTGDPQARLWAARERLSPKVARIAPTKISEDATVPIDKIAAFLDDLQHIREEFHVDLIVFGHAGDGNLHPNLVVDERDPDMMDRAKKAIDALFRAALRHGGTLTGEHGIGRLKRPYLKLCLSPAEIAMMTAIKRALDPRGILNPGKAILDVEGRS
jgi:glycolate oxidase